jgi:glycosyltransferase involved in cell wall biosynthesis
LSDSGSERQCELSVVIPVLNEAPNLKPLHTALRSALEGLGISWEIVFVDDGSQDESFAILRDISTQDANVTVLRFGRRFGQTAALSAGFHESAGSIIITMDADLQNDPADIPVLLGTMAHGYDVVSGWRRRRQDALLSRRVPSFVANWLVSKVTGLHLHDYGCSLKAYRREVVENLNLYGEMHRFVPAVANWQGITVAEVPVSHHPRKAGKSKYGLSRTLRVVLDLVNLKFLLSYLTGPIQLFGKLGLGALLLGGLCALLVLYLRLAHAVDMTGNPGLYLAVLLAVIGIQFVTIGLLAEMMMRTYHETQQKPTYVVRERLRMHVPEERGSQ